MTEPDRTIRVFRVYIRATPEAVWQAITSPDWNVKYGYRAPQEYDLRPGGAFAAHPSPQMQAFGLPDPMVDGEILLSEPPHKLVQTYRFRFQPDDEAEGFSTLTWEISAESAALTRVVLTHDVTDMPRMDHAIRGGSGKLQEGAGGWPWILSDLKTLLETGSPCEL